MNTDTQIRTQLIRRIQKIPSNKLKELNELVAKLELTSPKKDKILSFAGAWSDIDSGALNSLTENLTDNRQRNKRRYDQSAD
jgi:hypothetical protein